MIAALCATIASNAIATEPSGPHDCASVAHPSERLSCYDRAYPPDAATRQAAAALATAAFGLDPGTPHFDHGTLPVPDRIEARVDDVRVDGGRRTLTLDNGQRWMLTDAGTRGHLASGDVVTIRQGTLGGHLLSTPAGAILRARRMR